MRTSSTIALIASLSLAGGGCAGKAKTASVGGDVYLLMQNGDVKRGAANTVRLLADSAPLRQAMNGLCRSYAERLAAHSGVRASFPSRRAVEAFRATLPLNWARLVDSRIADVLTR